MAHLMIFKVKGGAMKTQVLFWKKIIKFFFFLNVLTYSSTIRLVRENCSHFIRAKYDRK